MEWTMSLLHSGLTPHILKCSVFISPALKNSVHNNVITIHYRFIITMVVQKYFYNAYILI